jgi:hypothetical protein
LLSHAGPATSTDIPGAAGSLSSKPHIIIGGPRASVTSVSSTSPNGLYGPEEVVGIDVNFTRPVFVTGVPELALNNGANAYYTGGSSSSSLTFSYTVGTSGAVARLDEASAGSLILAGSTIRDGRGRPAIPTVPTPGAAGSLGAEANLVINPAAADRNYVDAIYSKVLGPSASSDPGAVYWVNKLESLEQQGNSPDAARATVASGIVHSSGALGAVVNSLYQTILRRDADPGSLSYWTGQMLNGATKEQVMASILASPEFQSKANTWYPSGNGNWSYIYALYQVVLERTPSYTEVEAWSNALPSLGYYQVASDFVTCNEFRFDQVSQMYQSYLGRAGSSGEVSFWVSLMDANPAAYNLLSVEAALLASREFYDRVQGT